MWNLLGMRKNQAECRNLRDILEDAADVAPLSAAQQEHLAACAACREAAENIFATRAILLDVHEPAAEPAAWFAPRVMAAIAAKESELRQSLEAWAAVPRFAARLTWVSALALLLASTWLYRSPQGAQSSGAQSAKESLFDSPQSAATDDVLPAMERGQ
jgi:hypothetical protein